MKIKITVLALAFAFALTGCNRQVFDFKLKFTKAMVRWPDGKTETLDVRKWCDYEGDQLQIITKDGKTYVFHSMNVVLMSE